MRKLLLLLLLPFCLRAQFIISSGTPSSTILHIEVRDYDNNQGCAGNNDGWTWFTWWNGYTLARPDSALHCENGGYNDSAASAVVNNIQYQVDCSCNNDNPINMFIRNYKTGAKTDSLIIYSDQTGHTTHRLTLLGICKLSGTDSLLLGGYERYNHPPAITHPDTMYGIWRWLPNETTAYWVYNTEVSGSYGMNGLAMNGNLLYIVSEMSDTLEVINTTTWTQSAVKDMAQSGGSFRGIAIIGSTILVGNDTDTTIDYYDLTTLNALVPATRDMSDFAYGGNILYGLWTINEYR